jgi:RNA polymerase sigma-70 factor (ECF subfamily)
MHAPVNVSSRLLAEARAGSTEALGELLELYRAYLRQVARVHLNPRLNPKADASDLVQETFLDAHRDFDHFRGEDDAELRAWLRRLLLNNAANFFRRFRPGGKRSVELEVSLASARLAALIAWEVSLTPSPDDHADAHEQACLLEKALHRLPDVYRRVLHLHYREQRSFEEIAGLLNCTPNAARKTAARALKIVQQQLRQPD